MALVDEVNEQLKVAMREKDTVRLRALRNIRAGFIEALKSDGRAALTDEDALPILRKLAKSLADNEAEYQKAGREDLAAAERDELAVITSFLPALADEATTRAWIEAAIASTGAASVKEMGKVMGVLMASHKDTLDARLAQKLVREALS